MRCRSRARTTLIGSLGAAAVAGPRECSRGGCGRVGPHSDDGPGHDLRPDDGDGDGHGQSERRGDHLVLRVRRDARATARRPRRRMRLGTTNANVSSPLSGPPPGNDLSLPRRRDESTGTTPGRRRHLHDRSRRPASPPAAPTGVSATGGTLNGSVNPNGRATTWFFEYGTSASYGSQTAVQNAGTGDGAVPVSAAIAGLRSGASLPLPPRRDERRRHEPGRRSDVRARRGAERRHQRRELDRNLDRPRSTAASTRRPVDDVLLRVRHDDRATASKTAPTSAGSVELGAERLRVDLGPRPGDDVPLPPRRLERIRDDARRRSDSFTTPDRRPCRRARPRTATRTAPP